MVEKTVIWLDSAQRCHMIDEGKTTLIQSAEQTRKALE